MNFVSGNPATVNNVVKNVLKTQPTCVLTNTKLTRFLGLIHHKFLALLYCYTFLSAVSIFTIHFDTFKLNIARWTSLTASVSDDGNRGVNVVVYVYKRDAININISISGAPSLFGFGSHKLKVCDKNRDSWMREGSTPWHIALHHNQLLFSHQAQTCKH